MLIEEADYLREQERCHAMEKITDVREDERRRRMKREGKSFSSLFI
jgi:hypothetical protein